MASPAFRDLEPLNPAKACACVLSVKDALVSLSSNEQLLAVGSGTQVSVYQLASLVKGSITVLAEWTVPSGGTVKQVTQD
jgi:hypothetical protein